MVVAKRPAGPPGPPACIKRPARASSPDEEPSKRVAVRVDHVDQHVASNFDTVKLDALPDELKLLALTTLPWMEQLPAMHSRDLDVVELFCGHAAITRAARAAGLHAFGYDRKHGEGEDILTEIGWRRAIDLTLRLKPSGSLWCAPWCGPWTFINRSGTRRTTSNPAGDPSGCPRVASSNAMVTRVGLLIILAHIRGCHTWLEQPPSSLMLRFGIYPLLLVYILCHKQQTWLGHFGSTSPKPVIIYSSLSLHAIACTRPADARLSRLCDRSGEAINGRAGDLRASQAYPERFGKIIAALMKDAMRRGARDMVQTIFGEGLLRSQTFA